MGVIAEFKKFALRGSLIDLTIGFTVGAAFTTIAKSLVSDIIMPPVGLLLGGQDFSDLFVTLKSGKVPGPYATLAQAQQAGAVTMNLGVFFNSLIAFLIVTGVMFLLIRAMSRLERSLETQFGETRQPGEPTDKLCPSCRMTIPFKATRCPHCTSELKSEQVVVA